MTILKDEVFTHSSLESGGMAGHAESPQQAKCIWVGQEAGGERGEHPSELLLWEGMGETG